MSKFDLSLEETKALLQDSNNKRIHVKSSDDNIKSVIITKDDENFYLIDYSKDTNDIFKCIKLTLNICKKSTLNIEYIDPENGNKIYEIFSEAPSTDQDFVSIVEAIREFLTIAHFSGEHKPELKELQKLYRTLISEEKLEVEDACASYAVNDSKDNKAHVLKEICDLLWVTIGLAIHYDFKGIDIRDGMVLLLREFASKMQNSNGDFEPEYREDGKLLKGKYYQKADFTQLIK